tara:strand:+ start:453 stop:638 length:186 start_codon:yes stop_codon:yes gene_type:complete
MTETIQLKTTQYPSDAIATRSEAIQILKDHGCRIEDFKDFINIIGIDNEYSIQELKDFLGY